MNDLKAATETIRIELLCGIHAARFVLALTTPSESNGIRYIDMRHKPANNSSVLYTSLHADEKLISELAAIGSHWTRDNFKARIESIAFVKHVVLHPAHN